MIKNKLKELLSELENFKVQTVLVLHYMKRNDPKIFHSRAKLIASDSDIDETFIFMQWGHYDKKWKKYICKDWIVLDVNIKHSIKIFEC